MRHVIRTPEVCLIRAPTDACDQPRWRRRVATSTVPETIRSCGSGTGPGLNWLMPESGHGRDFGRNAGQSAHPRNDRHARILCRHGAFPRWNFAGAVTAKIMGAIITGASQSLSWRASPLLASLSDKRVRFKYRIVVDQFLVRSHIPERQKIMASPAIDFVRNNQQRFLGELKNLLRIPSISTLDEHKNDVQKAADFVASELRRIGMENVEVVATKGHPLLYADWLHAPGKPTVLMYAHYDVQPPDPVDEWHSPPFEPTERNGNIYARGAVDDKGQLWMEVKRSSH